MELEIVLTRRRKASGHRLFFAEVRVGSPERGQALTNRQVNAAGGRRTFSERQCVINVRRGRESPTAAAYRAVAISSHRPRMRCALPASAADAAAPARAILRSEPSSRHAAIESARRGDEWLRCRTGAPSHGAVEPNFLAATITQCARTADSNSYPQHLLRLDQPPVQRSTVSNRAFSVAGNFRSGIVCHRRLRRHRL